MEEYVPDEDSVSCDMDCPCWYGECDDKRMKNVIIMMQDMYSRGYRLAQMQARLQVQSN